MWADNTVVTCNSKRKSLAIFKKDIFGNFHFTKRILYFLFGSIAMYRFKRLYKTRVEGTHILEKLPDNGVLFVSNHQTYFADVAMMFLVFASVKAGHKNKLVTFSPSSPLV